MTTARPRRPRATPPHRLTRRIRTRVIPTGRRRGSATYGQAPIDEAPYGAPEDAYPYPYPAEDGGGRGGPGALPIIGFILLGVLALGVGARWRPCWAAMAG